MKESGFESFAVVSKHVQNLSIPFCRGSLSCINEYLAIVCSADILTKSFRAVNEARMNDGQRRRVGDAMNRSALS